jgi:hypothetical protein
MLVEMASKMIGYLDEAESRVRAEESARRKLSADFEKRVATLERVAAEATAEAARAHAELTATRDSHGATLDALVEKVRARCMGPVFAWGCVRASVSARGVCDW